MCNGRHRYCIYPIPGEIPKWLSYSGEGCSLSFHVPPVFQGLVVWFVCSLEKEYHYYLGINIINIIIRNKSNGIQLFEYKRIAEAGRWIRYISRSEMAMEDYCGDDKLELYIYSQPRQFAAHIKECGVHMIAGKSDSFEESEVGRDTVMLSPPYYLLPHSHCGSITVSAPKQWSDYFFPKLRKYNLSLTLDGKNKYFI